MNWIKKHPYISGSLVLLVVVYFVVRNSVGGSQQVTGTTGPSEALQAANLQASVQKDAIASQLRAQQMQLDAALAGKNIDAATALEIAKTQKDVANASLASQDAQARTTLEAILAQITGQNTLAGINAGAAQGMAQINADGSARIASINAGAATGIAGIQAGVNMANIAAQLEASKLATAAGVTIAGYGANVEITRSNNSLLGLYDNNLTARDLATIGAKSDFDLATIGAGVANYKTATDSFNLNLQLEATKWIAGNNNQTAITLNQSNNDVKTYTVGKQYDLGALQSNNNLSLYNNYINTQGQIALGQQQVDLTQINTNYDLTKIGLNLVSSGQINKGGEGGANQVSVIGAIFGQPTVGNAAQQVQQGNTWGSILNGFGNVVQGVGQGLFGAVTP